MFLFYQHTPSGARESEHRSVAISLFSADLLEDVTEVDR